MAACAMRTGTLDACACKVRGARCWLCCDVWRSCCAQAVRRECAAVRMCGVEARRRPWRAVSAARRLCPVSLSAVVCVVATLYKRTRLGPVRLHDFPY
jgi:hypothetical protein